MKTKVTTVIVAALVSGSFAAPAVAQDKPVIALSNSFYGKD